MLVRKYEGTNSTNVRSYLLTKLKIMTAKEINQSVMISEYLSSKGIFPSKRYNGYSMYLSPFREERSPSLKVSETKNLWIDYGTNEGGTLIDLVLKMFPNFSVSRAIMEIKANLATSSVFSFHPPVNLNYKADNGFREIKNKGINIYKVQKLGSNPALTDYLSSRGIRLSIANRYCKEVYFNIGQKRFFGLGNQNQNGWAIRNKFWKGCSAQGVSLYKNGHSQLAIFEGIFDLLSYLELEDGKDKAQDFMVLNSLANLNRSSAIASCYKSVSLFLDNDESGKKASVKMINIINNCYDLSTRYSEYKDLNEYWMFIRNQKPLLEKESK